jgi:hypothetical protein
MADVNSEPMAHEQCLAELREMFPKSRCQLTDTTVVRGGFGIMEFDRKPKLYEHANGRVVEIWLMDVKPSNSELGIKMRGPTPDEAMDQVRAWKAREGK